ncbi:MAG: hypothetical protein PHH85_11235 [Candidatus Methanoperedens sp.]|nr:hypothetical protein [Candidatus Methanoperedens sp.]
MYGKLLIAFCIILSVSGASQAALYEDSLKVSLIKYDPYPVSPDSDFGVWVQLENVGDNDVSAVSIEFVPKYPFSIKPGDSAVKYPGTIRKDDKIIYKFSLHVDKNALVGTNKIEIGYRVDGSFTKKEFDIEVGSDVVDARGTVRMDKYSLSPEVFMAGDTGTVALTLKNSATAYTIKIDGRDYSMNAQIKSAELLGNEFIDVTSEPYYNPGIIGPGDSLELHYTIKVRDNTPDGTYFLDFALMGSARLYSLNLKIPIRVDSSSIETALSEKPKTNPGKVILNIANNRPNTLQAVTVIPSGNVTFEPAEYFIGTMEPDELFTVKFDLKSGNPGNVSFRLRFKNGDNWHESEAMSVALDGSNNMRTESGNKSTLLVLGILGAALVLVGGFFVYMRRRRAKSG